MMKQNAMDQYHYIAFFKPFDVLSQFTSEAGHASLADFGPFPQSVYAAGRLDVDSEGLLILTDDAQLKHRLTSPEFGHPRTYLVQVEGIPDPRSIRRLESGVLIERKKTLPATAELLSVEPHLPERSKPIRFRKSVPTSWLKLTLREGRNRQARKMTAAVGYPTLRLVRVNIGRIGLDGLKPGEQRTLSRKDVMELREDLGLMRMRER